VTTDHLITLLVVAFFVILPVVQGLRTAKRGFDKVVADQKAQTPAQRIAAVEAGLAARGITPSPGVRAAIDAYEATLQPAAPAATAAAATAQAAAVTAPASAAAPVISAGYQRAAVQRPIVAPRRPVPSAPAFDPTAAPVTPVGTTRRTVADAFGDPPHARNAVILAEILGPPVALR
jgi:hypothetical protein